MKEHFTWFASVGVTIARQVENSGTVMLNAPKEEKLEFRKRSRGATNELWAKVNNP